MRLGLRRMNLCPFPWGIAGMGERSMGKIHLLPRVIPLSSHPFQPTDQRYLHWAEPWQESPGRQVTHVSSVPQLHGSYLLTLATHLR